ncbi:nuclear transport factor 2 family protein [Actinocorallia sp. API 0066]|uniref:nuclear transport factor 2 family protein n=1 Tax=Actinocorallia sp. API 0066 TaxID=2896846 RepID=UPI001E42F6F1|nr:nuclear transport factor 2 family protein [Actinocorallia sp. API 0066]MCD0450298.1 nuclear transport factor 2 family protein [Actinocorallia sp. API 0066]
MHPFRAAVEKGDADAFAGLLAPDAVFNSPVAFKPYRGRETVAAILRAATRVFDDLRYVQEIADPDTGAHALVFKARIGPTEVHGCDFLTVAPNGEITDFTVMLRPMSAVHAMSEAMRPQFDIIARELAGS